jgi:hypothetical protein
MLSTLTTSRFRWPLLVCALFALVCLLAPAGAGAKVRLLGPGDGEGDPVDGNNHDDDSDDTGDDIHDTQGTTESDPAPWNIFEMTGLRIVILPSTLGALPFEVLIMSNATPEDVYAR